MSHPLSLLHQLARLTGFSLLCPISFSPVIHGGRGAQEKDHPLRGPQTQEQREL